jgi:predicted ATPase/DNA-binding SARP family transcriptional activator
MPKLSINLLGPVQIALDGQPLAGFPYSRSRVLLIYLALESAAPQRRDLLATLLWPNQSDAEARHSLRQALATLRREIADAQAEPPALQVTRETIQLNPAGGAELDVRTFERLLAPAPSETPEQSAQRLERALALYRGDLLEQFGLPDCPDLERWVGQRRERLRDCTLEALKHLAASYEQTGALEPSQRVARRWLALDPWCEEAHRHLMRTLARGGQRSAALLQYETCRRILAEELGLAPDEATTALYKQIRAASEGRSVSPAHLPALPNRLIGRAEDSAAVRALLQREDTRLVTLVGTPGIGKTSLALQVAAELSGAFPDGVFFVGLAPLGDAAQVQPAIAKALDVDEGEAALVTHLRRRRVLLLLDNWEHLLDAAPLLADLLAACPQLKVLATSREPLRIRAERRYALRPLALPEPDADLATTTEAAAVALFVDRASASAPGFALSAANARAVAAICARLDGLPLAIELVAARAESLAPEALLEQLDCSLALLTDGPRDLPARQRTLRDAIGWSYALLPEREQTLFAWLGVFRGGFDLGAVQTLAGDPDAAAAVRALAEKSLVQHAHPGGAPQRFSLLETLRAYALERLAASGQHPETQRRHAAIYAALAETARPQVGGVEARRWRQRLERDHDNIRAALAWLLEHDPEAALRMAGALGLFWSTCGYHSEGRRWLAQALAHGGDDRRARARALQADATLAVEQGQHAEALRLAKASLALHRALEDPRGAAQALRTCAWIATDTRDPSEAVDLFTQSLELFRQDGDPGGVAEALLALAYVARQQGQTERAGALLRESVQIAHAIGHLETVAFGYQVQCSIDLRLADYAAAVRNATEALALFERTGLRRDSAWAQAELGEALWFQGQLAPAQAAISAALAIFEDLGIQQGIAVEQHMLGQIERRLGHLKRAEACYRSGLTLSRQMDFIYIAARCLAGLGLLALAQADIELAALLLGAGLAHIDALPPFLTPAEWAEYEQARQTLRKMLGPEAFRRAWGQSQALTSEQADALALRPEMISRYTGIERCV